jgi:hypothetical protein
MASLVRGLRKDLEKTVKQARRVAEAGARKVLEQLGVHHHEPYGFMSPEQRTLRNRLRAHGRQLGDRRDPQKGTQAIGRLVQECAYEHWHRMLFARFLAETDLLIEPQSGVAITLEESQELARDEGADWLELASGYAERMLPQIFRKDDPVLAISLPPETRSELEDLLKALPSEVFTADDSLGWVYQFWQADAKEIVNKSEKKIGEDELPAVTQLFTEDYMVLFLLHNTLGAWWAGKVLAERPELATSAKSEDELRGACKVGDVEWTYLRIARDEAADGTEKSWRPAAGAFEGWPSAAKDLTMLDPCMGSGHFLVFALPILVAFRMEEEGLSEAAAVDAVLRDNLFGLEIDPRCTQIAAFNLAFAAWRRAGFHALPALNLACSGLAIGVTKAEWLRLAGKAAAAADPDARRDLLGVEDNLLTHGLEERVKNGLEALYDLFSQAPWLGSLIDPRRASADIFREGFDNLRPMVASILEEADSDETREMAVTAQGMAKAAELLSLQYSLVVTNPPFLGELKQHERIRSWCGQKYSSAKADLATSVLLRSLKFAGLGGSVAFVTPEEWLFLKRYANLRKKILRDYSLKVTVRLGYNAFLTPLRTAPALSIISNLEASGDKLFLGNITNISDFSKKSKGLKSADLASVERQQLINAPSMRLMVGAASDKRTLREFATAATGMLTGDNTRFFRCFWEVDACSRDWVPLQTSPMKPACVSGRHQMLLWERGQGQLAELAESVKHLNHVAQNWRRGQQVWGKEGVVIQGMGRLVAAPYVGDHFDNNCFVLLPINEKHLVVLRAYCASEEFYKSVREIDSKTNITRGDTFLDISADLDEWALENADQLAGLEFSNEPSELSCDGWVEQSSHPLQVAVARLLGFNWHQSFGSSRTQSQFRDALQIHSDDDGIVSLIALKGEESSEQRLNALLADAYGTEWSAAKLANLLTEIGFAGKSLDDWLRDGFFAQHCELFQQRPFIWHIWDGRRDGFHALVNYHRLTAANGEGRRTLEKLIYSYLGDWIDRQRVDQKAGIEGADARLAHAEHLRAELIKILEGEPPYDIFVRWKPLNQQPIGWDSDINDGVRMNIRPFMTALPLGARAKNACILRFMPKIKWQKDRGKEPMRDKEDYPWFWDWDEATLGFAGGDKFDGNRWNDLHYSNSLKQDARACRSAKVEDKT